jgi:hypothetical protein
MAATIIGYEGGMLGLVAVLLLLAVGLAGALLAATRRDAHTARTVTPGTGSLRGATGRPSLARGEQHR